MCKKNFVKKHINQDFILPSFKPSFTILLLLIIFYNDTFNNIYLLKKKEIFV